ncbi:5'-3' exoribonuclease [Anaeramoeba flamelloides]|uniref:5'-3' exoribonuclease n=1 Tax=Anaeramoeba flamelloides TaxID=1746091 RepID=A0ABQ8YRM8_9EUKA|nr:5'-3' exoribonuclease [Anaeramoeba flamelloides]
MGVPKFFRWVCERYPLILQKYLNTKFFFPEFDNFYIDATGFIHQFFIPEKFKGDFKYHPNDQTIFNDVCNLIDTLVKLVNPKKVLFIAFDGVSPRFKINESRNRRYLTGLELQEMLDNDTQQNRNITPWNSTKITLGSKFSSKFDNKIREFIQSKMEKEWKHLKVIYSSHLDPGEGEHKIIEYMKNYKNSDNYDANSTHCLFGNDADLIILSLVTNLPKIAVLRWKIDFRWFPNKSKNVAQEIEDLSEKFEFVFINTLREYIEYDLISDLNKNKNGKKKNGNNEKKEEEEGENLIDNDNYDIERLIDDWVLLTFFFGNDFLPALPFLQIKEGSFDRLLKVYKSFYPKNGYIINKNIINWNKYEKFIKLYREIETKEHWLRQLYPNNDRYGKKKSRRSKKNKISEKYVSENTFHWNVKYYTKYFGEDVIKKESFKPNLIKNYLKSIQWNLNYYYKRIPSWTYHYPFHFPPVLADLENLNSYSINEDCFQLNQPFDPMLQMLCSLPPISHNLLPTNLGDLMIKSDSPIVSYFPKEIKVIPYNRNTLYLPQCVIPLFDYEIIKTEYEKHLNTLTKEELERNKVVDPILFYYDQENNLKKIDINISSDDLYQLIYSKESETQSKGGKEKENENEKEKEKEKEKESEKEKEKIKENEKENELINKNWPTLNFFSIVTEIKKVKVNLFGNSSELETVVLKLNAKESNSSKLEKAVGKSGYICYPYPKLVHINSVSDKNQTINQQIKDKVRKTIVNKVNPKNLKKNHLEWSKKKKYLVSKYREQYGIDLKNIPVVFNVKTKQTNLEQIQSMEIPIQLILPRENFLKKFGKKTKIERNKITVGSTIFYFHQLKKNKIEIYQATIKKINRQKYTISVDANRKNNICPSLNKVLTKTYKRWFDMKELSNKLNVNVNVLRKFLNSFIFDRKHQIGLQIFVHKKRVFKQGYCKVIKTQTQKMPKFSNSTLSLLNSYKDKFPQLFKALSNYHGPLKSDFLLKNYVNDPDQYMEKVTKWIRERKLLYKLPLVNEDFIGLSINLILEIENDLIKNQKKKNKNNKNLNNLIINENEEQMDINDGKNENENENENENKNKNKNENKNQSYPNKDKIIFEKTVPRKDIIFPRTLSEIENRIKSGLLNINIQLGDIVINKCINNQIPFGLRGIIVGYYQYTNKVEVIFEKNFNGATNLENRLNTLKAQRLHISQLINLSHYEREKVQKMFNSPQQKRKTNQDKSDGWSTKNTRKGGRGQGKGRGKGKNKGKGKGGNKSQRSKKK